MRERFHAPDSLRVAQRIFKWSPNAKADLKKKLPPQLFFLLMKSSRGERERENINIFQIVIHKYFQSTGSWSLIDLEIG